MQKLKAFLLAALVSQCLRGTVPAGLVWEQRSLSFNPGVSDTEVIAHFKFQNSGASTVVIKSVTTACDCTTASAAKQSYAAGEKGEITAKFLIEDSVGAQQKEICVETDDPANPKTTLTLKVTAPKIAEIEPDPLLWTPGGPLQPKRLRVTAAKGVMLKLTAVKSSDPRVLAQIEAGARPGEFEIVVTPSGDSPSFAGALRIETDFPKEHPKALVAHVQIAR